MPQPRYCDFCGRSEFSLLAEAPIGMLAMELDDDGLWVCFHCRGKLVLHPVGEETANLAEELRALVGKSAGAICHTLNLPYELPYRSVIDAASQIAYDEDRYMSAWSFVTEWADGTTVWRSEDRSALALVTPDGSVSVQRS